MTRNEALAKVQENFAVEELVCPHIIMRDGSNSWKYFDTQMLETIAAIRSILGAAMYVNNWANGGKYSERGCRCNLCSLVKDKTKINHLYVSPHILFKAIDFDCGSTLSTEAIIQKIKDNADKLPYPIRIEKGTVGWVHIDTYPFEGKKKIYEFNA